MCVVHTCSYFIMIRHHLQIADGVYFSMSDDWFTSRSTGFQWIPMCVFLQSEDLFRG